MGREEAGQRLVLLLQTRWSSTSLAVRKTGGPGPRLSRLPQVTDRWIHVHTAHPVPVPWLSCTCVCILFTAFAHAMPISALLPSFHGELPHNISANCCAAKSCSGKTADTDNSGHALPLCCAPGIETPCRPWASFRQLMSSLFQPIPKSCYWTQGPPMRRRVLEGRANLAKILPADWRDATVSERAERHVYIQRSPDGSERSWDYLVRRAGQPWLKGHFAVGQVVADVSTAMGNHGGSGLS